VAAPLTDAFGPEIPRTIAARIQAVHPGFNRTAFCRAALDGYLDLGLLARGLHIARALRLHLPDDYPRALKILLASIGPRPTGHSMATFFYLPHTQFVAEFGLDHPEISLDAQHALTRRFTAEFSIRPFIVRHPGPTFERLHRWADDPDPHVRRLVSEGTRPRLPWAMRLTGLQRDPSPVLPLLEKLRDDPDPAVRRSVANHLNDIGKDHPDLLARIARAWLKGATASRRRLVEHALRSAVKRGHPGALAALGCHKAPDVVVEAVRIEPGRPTIGEQVRIRCRLRNPSTARQSLIADLRVHFVKARGTSAPKVFKMARVELPAGAARDLAKSVSLAVHTTRKPYPGRHGVELLLNGRATPLGHFDLQPAR
jgi:3-methyladenine DNA glycosylase AlkC